MTQRSDPSIAVPRAVRPARPKARRREIVLEPPPAQPATLASVFAGLKSLGERGGALLGEAYALAASTVLVRLERIEDLSAERRYRQRSKSAAARSARASRTAGPATPSLSGK